MNSKSDYVASATRNEWNDTWNGEQRANEWLQMESAGDGEIVWHVKLLPEQRTCRRRHHKSAESRANNLHSFSGCDFYIYWHSHCQHSRLQCKNAAAAASHQDIENRDALMPSRLSFIRFVSVQSNQPSHPSSHSTERARVCRRWMCFLFNFLFHFVLFVSFVSIRRDFSFAIFVLRSIFRLTLDDCLVSTFAAVWGILLEYLGRWL